MNRVGHRALRRAPAAATLAACLFVLMTDRAIGQPAHATVPYPTPYFSIDRTSPSVNPNLRARDVLDKPGPLVAFQGSGLGMADPVNDELDALSFTRNDVTPNEMFLIVFSVDRASVGGIDPDDFLVESNRPFNVKDQAAKHQASGDLFMTTLPFTRNGGGGFAGGGEGGGPEGGTGDGNNTLVKNQGDAGGTDFDLEPEESPSSETDPDEDKDELDSAATKEEDASGGSSFGGGTPAPRFYYSLSKDSPSLATLPGTPSGANIYTDILPTTPGTEQFYVLASQLGLIPGAAGDDIDALVVFDPANDGQYNPTTDQVLFSLSPGSPTLQALGITPAHIIRHGGGLPPIVFARPVDMGLADTDNIDAIEVLTTTNVTQSLLNHAIFQVLPGDNNSNGMLEGSDCAGFDTCWSGQGMTYDTNGFAMRDVSVGPGPMFNPAIITIETGDTVRWTWMGGLHNVVSGSGGLHDGVFHSGAPTSVTGTVFSVPFNEALLNLHPHGGGIYPYYSEPDLPAQMHGTVVVAAHPCATYDIDLDGDVDCNDWQEFKELYLQFNTAICQPLTIPEFVLALLGTPVLQAHKCMADMNNDGLANGRDVPLYVQSILP